MFRNLRDLFQFINFNKKLDSVLPKYIIYFTEPIAVLRPRLALSIELIQKLLNE